MKRVMLERGLAFLVSDAKSGETQIAGVSDMAVSKDRPGAYAPGATVLTVIERHRNKGLPSPIDADVLGRAGLATTIIPRTLQSLQTLDLITEDGKPTEVFESIRLAPEAEYKQRLVDWLTAAYADALQYVDPAKDDEIKIRDAFRSYVPTGQQDRMVSLFIALFTAAGVMPARSKAAPAARSAIRMVPASQAPRYRAARKPTQQDRHQTRHDLPSSLPPALSGLMASLPSEEAGWTQAQRDKFYSAFGVMLDFCFPIVAAVAEPANGNGD